jgi:hypothetical protein
MTFYITKRLLINRLRTPYIVYALTLPLLLNTLATIINGWAVAVRPDRG